MWKSEYDTCLVGCIGMMLTEFVYLPGIGNNQKTGEVVLVCFNTFLKDFHTVTFSCCFGADGSVSQVLSILSFYNINLTKIQSLPIIGREWEYQFYVDVAFNDYLRYKQSIAAITPLTKELKLLGEYAEGKSNV